MKIAAYILAKNEEKHIASALDSLRWCDEIIVADTGSSDKTCEIAESRGARVVNIPFDGFGATRNRAIEQIKADWIICFDADEICTQELAVEIIQTIRLRSDISALQAPRQNYFLGRKIRHSGWYPDYRHPVAFKPSECSYSDDAVHERMIVNGKTLRLTEPLAHFPYDNIDHMVAKAQKYAKLGAPLTLKKHPNLGLGGTLLHAVSAFFRHYVLRRGFLDGFSGFIIAVNASYYTFFRYAQALELKHQAKLENPKEIPASLKQ
jgi:glycosyltransferase involved in cell wall biosynthesis